MGVFNKVLDWILSRKAVSDWYRRNGYYMLADISGYDSYTGQSVTETTALEASAVYACVKILSEDMGNLPFFLMRRSKDGMAVEKARDHRYFSVLHDLVNPEVGAGEFVESLTAQAALLGDGYALIQEFGNGNRQAYLWPLSTGAVRPDQDSRRRRVYVVNDAGREKTYSPRDIFHLRGFTFNCLTGDPILSRARHLIGLSLSAQEFAGRYFANDVSAGLFLEHPQSLGPEGVENILAAYKKKQGSSHAGEPFVLQEGMKASRMDPDLEKMQLVDVRKFQTLEACRIFRMPPHKLADLDRATFSNIEHLAIEYVQHTLSPWVRRWREAVYRCLLTREEQMDGRLFAEHSVEALLRGDFAGQTEGFAKLLEKGVYSINEVRRWLNLNPVDGGDGHYIQLNMQDVQTIAKAATVEVLKELKSLTDGRHKELLERQIERLEVA